MSLSQGSKESGTNEWKKIKKIHQTSQNYTELLCPKLLCMLHICTTLPFGFGRTDKRPVPHKDSPEPFSPQHQIWSLISTSGMGSRSLYKFKRYSGYLALVQRLRVSFSPGMGRLTNLGLAHFGSDFKIFQECEKSLKTILHTVSWMVGMTRHTRQADPFHYYTFIICGNEKETYYIIENNETNTKHTHTHTPHTHTHTTHTHTHTHTTHTHTHTLLHLLLLRTIIANSDVECILRAKTLQLYLTGMGR